MKNFTLGLWLVPTITFLVFCGALFSLFIYAFKTPDTSFQDTGEKKRPATATELRKALERRMLQ
ncbi:hypothetical protein ACFOPX_01910 [Helicobacter baculiformis]|uniref:Uncharacterized protein n=1 Tax=Helicobacter baculiformis TaxID=427351 RepID=A0ABV7ZIR0_9HELI|nr:hypothetical protein [Helicobacter baculiformis]